MNPEALPLCHTEGGCGVLCCRFGSGHSEDMYFSLDAGELLHKPSYQDGRRFSFETILPDSDVRPLGLHKPWDYLPGGVIEQVVRGREGGRAERGWC